MDTVHRCDGVSRRSRALHRGPLRIFARAPSCVCVCARARVCVCVCVAFTTKSASVVLIRRCPRRCGRPLQRDVHGLKVLACYTHIMTFKNRAAVVAARDLTECNIVRQALDQLLKQGDAAKRDPNSPWRTTYGGRTEDNNSGIDRKDLHFSDKPSGAKKLQAFLREGERLKAHMTICSRLLANGKDNFETEQLEALLGQFAGVGGVVGLNKAHMGPWRYGKKGGYTALRFCMRASRKGHGEAKIREVTRPCRRTARSVPRRTRPNNKSTHRRSSTTTTCTGGGRTATRRSATSPNRRGPRRTSSRPNDC